MSVPTIADDEHAIRAVVDAWRVATQAGDVHAIADLLTDDVVFLTPGRPPFGKAEFLAASRGMAGVCVTATSDIEELHVAGTLAYLRSLLAVSITPPDGVTIKKSGTTLTILRKEGDGRWRLARDANLLT